MPGRKMPIPPMDASKICAAVPAPRLAILPAYAAKLNIGPGSPCTIPYSVKNSWLVI